MSHDLLSLDVDWSHDLVDLDICLPRDLVKRVTRGHGGYHLGHGSFSLRRVSCHGKRPEITHVYLSGVMYRYECMCLSFVHLFDYVNLPIDQCSLHVSPVGFIS